MALIVNGEIIEDSVVRQEVERLRPHYESVFADRPRSEREAQLLEWSRENVVELTLLNHYARQHVEPMPPEQVEAAFEQLRTNLGGDEQLKNEFGDKSLDEIKQQVELQLRVGRLLEDNCKDLPQPSNEAVSEFYEKNRDEFYTPLRIRVAHIVSHINWQSDETAAHEKIVQAADELGRGVPFEMLVTKYSDCPDNGGDLGYITRGQMVEEFEDVVFNLDINQVSDIFRTRFGFHMAKVYDKKPPVILPLEKVRDQIISRIREQMRSDAIDDFLDRLRSSAVVEQV